MFCNLFITLQQFYMLSLSNSQPSHKPALQHKQFPLYYTNPSVDSISKALTAFGNMQQERIIYMGQRYTSNYKLFKSFSSPQQSQQANQIVHPEIYSQKIIQKYGFKGSLKQKFYPVRSHQYRLFNGMNPTIKKDELHFDSYFQCGNLDLVVSLGNSQYDLFMRVDSNTKGHTCWFFYKITNFNHKQRIKMNLVNFSRSELSYNIGMKVYAYRSSCNEWKQQGQNISFKETLKCKYAEPTIDQNANRYFTLSFQYEFNSKDEYVYFAYCIPYSYSYLQLRVKEIQTMHSTIVEVDRSNHSTGGLVLPILTITNNGLIKTEGQEKEQAKKVCLIIGRMHPGQTQSSWILQGFINYLCSPKAKQLRDKLIFKIVPMVNADGVVAGNFRTNLLGRDLNRCFNQPQMLSEVALIRSMAAKYQPFMFLDFHGHSSKKNIFTYGPDYAIDHQYFIPSRLFAKVISKSAKAFRYFGCSFRLEEDKRSTSRAIMLRNHHIKYCFTFQASAHAFGPRRQQTLFDKNRYLQSGSAIACGLGNFVKIIFTLPKRYQNNDSNDTQKNLKTTRKMTAPSDISQLTLNAQSKKLLQQILKEQKEHFQARKVQQRQDSDFEQGNDYTQKQLRQMLNGDKQFIPKTKREKTKKPLFHDKSLKNPKITSNEETKAVPPTYQQRYKMQKIKNRFKHLSTQIQKQDAQLINNIDSIPLKIEKTGSRLKILSHKIFSQDSCLIFEESCNIKNQNNVGQSGLVKVNSGMVSNEIRRMKEKTSIMLKRRYKMKSPKLPQTTDREKKEDINQIKKSLLPLLKSHNAYREERPSVITQVFENRAKSRGNRYGKNMRLFHS